MKPDPQSFGAAGRRRAWERHLQNPLQEIYRVLYALYGPQGWWPLLDVQGATPTKTGSAAGYHPLDYDLPRTRAQAFEICAGAILTQNTAWQNVQKALLNLSTLEAMTARKISKLTERQLQEAIRPAGYFNQKARKLRIFAEYFASVRHTPTRQELLSLWGIGKETADSMLLYAFKVPIFVVDAYTRKIMKNLRFLKGTEEYDEVRWIFEESLKPDLAVYQEYHALLVKHAKRHYARGADLCACPLYQRCGGRKT
jgi:endonuclease-3 related protein